MRIHLAGAASAPDRPNEDYLAVAVPATGFGGVALVLDGVTPPSDGRSGCVHTVSWFTAHLGGALVELVGSRRELTLAECLADAVARTAAAHGAGCDLSHVHTPQATVAALRWDAERVEYLVLSDAVVLLQTMDGVVTPVLDNRLEELVRLPEIGALWAQRQALPNGSAQHREVSRSLGEAVDALRNVDGGFFTVASDPGVAGRAVTGDSPRSELRAAAVLTDGVSRFTEVFHLGDWGALLGALDRDGAQALVDRVRAAESADPEGTAYPRRKSSDDASVVFIGFS